MLDDIFAGIWAVLVILAAQTYGLFKSDCGTAMFDKELLAKAEEILNIGRDRHLRIASAESRTGGLIAARSRNSRLVERHRAQFCYLFNRAKHEVLGVDAEVVNSMARQPGGCARHGADTGLTTAHLVAVSGIGRGGSTKSRSAQFIWQPQQKMMLFCANLRYVRSALRLTVHAADMLLARLKD